MPLQREHDLEEFPCSDLTTAFIRPPEMWMFNISLSLETTENYRVDFHVAFGKEGEMIHIQSNDILVWTSCSKGHVWLVTSVASICVI